MNEKKSRTYYKNFHLGFNKSKGKGMTRGDVVEKLGCIKTQIFKWPKDTFITVRDLKRILGRCGYYISESQIRKISREGQLEGKKVENFLWIYPKSALYKWVKYLEEVGVKLLIKRGVIKEEKEDLLLISTNKNQERGRA